MMREKFIFPEQNKDKREKEPESIITAYVIRHGKSTPDKFNPERTLTEEGKEQTQKVAQKIAQEIMKEISPKQEIELRGYDSGVVRANQTLIEIVKILTEKGYKVYLPSSSQELAQDKQALEEMKNKGLIYGEGPGIKSRIKNMRLTQEAKKILKEEAKQKGIGVAETILTTPEEKLKEMGVETPQEVFDRIEKAVNITQRLAQRLKERKYPRRIISIAVSHGGVLESYLAKKLNIPPEKLGDIPETEGFKITFRGDKTEIKPWGEEIEKRLRE
jgi:broad specificity phosphatase PhoE